MNPSEDLIVLNGAVMTTALGAAALQSVPSTFAIGDFWSLTQQAGPLRWPIFFVLAFGLVQVFAKAYELIRDRWASSALHSVDFTSMSLDEIAELVSRQGASMLASLHATLVNVFQTRPAEGLLHDEITNFVRFQQDQFDVFRKRMEFLSDTAGALGLMGTVWGMFTVFFQGTAEQDVILRGMGIALITTLLGLIVSIILNFGSTELSTLFNKRLERVSTKSDELRFRLMELAPRPADLGRTVPPGVEAAGRVSKARGEATAEAGTLPGGTGPGTGSPIRSSPPLPGWRYVEFDGERHTVPAGEVASIGVVVKNGSDAPAAGVPVFVKIASGDAVLANGGRALRESSDAGGRVAVECRAPQRVGTFALEASLPEQPGSPSTVQVHVVAGEPQKIEKEGNNQAAVAGSRLPLPLGVRVHDRFGNPVRGLSVGFRVKQGDGKLGVGQTERGVTTDHQGLAATPFIVSSSAGQNIVAASIDGTKSTVEFVAFATEL